MATVAAAFAVVGGLSGACDGGKSPSTTPPSTVVSSPTGDPTTEPVTASGKVGLCRLNRGLNPASPVEVAPSPQLPPSLWVRPNEELYGTHFFPGADAYVIEPRRWRCGTLQGGTGMVVTGRPGKPSSRQRQIHIDVIANYDGAGGNYFTSCDWFRWAATQFHAFSTRECGHSRQPGAVVVTPVRTAVGLPYVTVVRTPADSAQVGDPRTGPGRFPTYDIAAMKDPSFLQGVRCVVPHSLIALCLRNIRLFLVTSKITKSMPLDMDTQVMAQVRAAVTRKS